MLSRAHACQMGEIAARFAPDSFIETKAPIAMPMTSATCHQFLPVAATWRAT
jgi:hypothetical protein